MVWADDPRTRRLLIGTLALALLLGMLYLSLGSRQMPVQLHVQGRSSPRAVHDCLASTSGQQKLGKLYRMRIGIGSWLNRDSRLFRSTRGHSVLVHNDLGVTSLTVRSDHALSPQQRVLLKGCVNSPPSW